MTFEEYQKESRKTAIYPNIGHNYIYPTLGLPNEAGEVVGKIKKILRDKDGKMNKDDVEEIEKELGDVLWYISQLATELKITMENIAKKNIEKLASRMERGVLKGSGDNR